MPQQLVKTFRSIFDNEGRDAFNSAAQNFLIATAVLIAKISGRDHLDAVLASIPDIVDQTLPPDMVTTLAVLTEAAQTLLH